MSFIEKTFLTTSTGAFFGVTFWLWADMGESVFVARALAFAQSCL
jgi:hypothetical protein